MKYQKHGIVAVITAAVGLSIYFTWPEDRAKVIQDHLSALELAARQKDDVAFERHRDELLALGHFEQQGFMVWVQPGTPESTRFITALMNESEYQPVCSWSPRINSWFVSVTATPVKMSEWKAFMSKWNHES